MSLKFTHAKNSIFALENTTMVGFVLFEITINSVYVRQIKVENAYQRKHIGYQLVNLLRKQYPHHSLYGDILTDYAAQFWANWDETIPVTDEDSLCDWIDNYGSFEISPLTKTRKDALCLIEN